MGGACVQQLNPVFGSRLKVHNGIEYGDMQLIGECYDIMKVCFE
jgi:6-phosphogluconate dehydrogenase